MSRTRSIVAWTDYALAALLSVACLNLLSGTLHPDPLDRHGGAFAVVAGIWLLPLPISFFIAGQLVSRNSRFATAAQTIAGLLLLALLAAVLWSLRA